MTVNKTQTGDADMAIYKKQELVATYPAYDVYKRDANAEGVVNITADDILVKPNHRGTYQPGSVASYALEYNECPMKAVEQCKQSMIDHPYNGHKLHWINALASCISSGPTKKIDVIEVHYGMKVKFEGIVSTIEKANNDNLQLKEVN
jgi:hypothetical protein